MTSNGMSIFYINVDVTFTKSMPCYEAHGRTKQLRGFLREFGVTADSEEQAKRLVEARVKSDFKYPIDNIRKIDFEWIGRIPEDRLEAEIFNDKDIVESDSFGDPREEGVWYCTGHAYYW